MIVDFSFGKSGLPLRLPEGFQHRLLKSRAAAPLQNQLQAVEEALDRPIGTPALQELARGRRSAAISVCDITRPAPNPLVLPPLIARLEEAGVRDISILIATGLHRPATEAEKEEICGREAAARYSILNHDARNLSQHGFLGNTSSGTPVYIDKRFLAADLHITLGFIEPHLMLGFSGGRKLIAPGLAAQETIKVLHSPKFMRDPRSFEGSIEQNPLHYELLEIARMARHDFLVDAALAAGEGRRPVAAVFAGAPEQAHRQGVKFVSEAMLYELDEPVDAVITTGAGYPLDLTFYQAIKGVTAAAQIVKPGGKILLLAECAEGAGGKEFSDMLAKHPSSGEFMDRIATAPVEVDQWQLEKLGMVTGKVDVLYFVPGLPSEYQSRLWGRPFSSAEAAIQALFSSLAPNSRVASIPEGPYVLAKVGEPAERI